MKFIEYKNILKENDIHLFDYDYRNTFKNIFILNDDIYNNKEQIGGSNTTYYLSPFIILKKDNNIKIKKIISNLKDDNIIGAKYLCKL